MTDKTMKQLLLLVVAFATIVLGSAIARADIRYGTYTLRPDSALYRVHRERSCGATRFLKEKLRLTYDEAGARVGSTPWDILDDQDGALYLGKGRHPNKVLYSLAVWQTAERVVHGEYVLYGFLATYDGDPYFPHGRPCEDRVSLVGTRAK